MEEEILTEDRKFCPACGYEGSDVNCPACLTPMVSLSDEAERLTKPKTKKEIFDDTSLEAEQEKEQISAESADGEIAEDL